MKIRLCLRKKYGRKLEDYYIDHMFLSENVLKFVTLDYFSISIPMEAVRYLSIFIDD